MHSSLTILSSQLYVLVDEYDNSVWKAATTRADNYKNFRDGVEAERQQRNLLVLLMDEAQHVVRASEDGLSDHSMVDVIREAGATMIAATSGWRTTSTSLKVQNSMPGMPVNRRRASNRPLCVRGGRSTCVASPVMTAFES